MSTEKQSIKPYIIVAIVLFAFFMLFTEAVLEEPFAFFMVCATSFWAISEIRGLKQKVNQKYANFSGTDTTLTENWAGYYDGMTATAISLNLQADKLYFTDGDDEEIIMLEDIIDVKKVNVYWLFPIGIRVFSLGNRVDTFSVPIQKRNKWFNEINYRINKLKSGSEDINNFETKIDEEPKIEPVASKTGRKMDL